MKNYILMFQALLIALLLSGMSLGMDFPYPNVEYPHHDWNANDTKSVK